jgi:hypothetical protein
MMDDHGSHSPANSLDAEAEAAPTANSDMTHTAVHFVGLAVFFRVVGCISLISLAPSFFLLLFRF